MKKKTSFAIIFLIALTISTFVYQAPKWILHSYLSMSLLTFIIYWLDKKKAKQGKWRTPEKTLHFLALLCGWPGALTAQSELRHKSAKASFLIIFWCSCVMNLACFILFFIPFGKKFL